MAKVRKANKTKRNENREFIKCAKTRGICNMHHWGMDASVYGSIKPLANTV